MDPDDLLDGHAVATSVHEKIRSCLVEFGHFDVRTSKSQIAFQRRRDSPTSGSRPVLEEPRRGGRTLDRT